MKKLIILGESHTRQFAHRKNIFPFFMGSGKHINLDKDNISKVTTEIKKILNNFDKKQYLTFLYLGEPNCRFPLKNHWTPHWDEIKSGKEVKPFIAKSYLQECIFNLGEIDLSNIDYILTPTSAYNPTQPALQYFKNILINEYPEKVINIFSNTIGPDLKVLDEYKAKNWEEDPIHVNSKIAEDFLNILKKKNIINSIDDYKSTINGYFGTHLLRNTNKSKFGSYIISNKN